MISPFVSFVSLLIYSFVVANSTSIYLSYFIIVLFTIFITKRLYLKEIFVLNIFVAMVVIPIAFSDIILAKLIFIRSNLIIILSLQLFYKKDLYMIIKALHTMRLPKKFVAVVFFAIKSIDILLKEIQKINKTLKARGFVAKTNIFTYTTYANMIAMLIIKCIVKSKQLQKALIIRGFENEIYIIQDNHYSLVDIVYIFVLVVSLLHIGYII